MPVPKTNNHYIHLYTIKITKFTQRNRDLQLSIWEIMKYNDINEFASIILNYINYLDNNELESTTNGCKVKLLNAR